MQLDQKLKLHRFPLSIISQTVWLYHRFNNSYRDTQEQMAFRGIILSHETVREWCIKFANHFKDVIKKCEREPSDKWHLDEMTVKINGKAFVLWRADDGEGIELDIFLQKHRNKKRAYPFPRIIVTNKLKSYNKPIKYMCSKAEYRSNKCLNNCIENAHQSTRRKEKSLIKFKSAPGVEKLLSLMGKYAIFLRLRLDVIKGKLLINDWLLQPPRPFGWRRL